MRLKNYSNNLEKVPVKKDRTFRSLLFKLIIFILFLILIYMIIANLRISKFDFVFNKNFYDYDDFKIIGINTLKDQSLFFQQRNEFEKEIKEKFPEIYEIRYEVTGIDSIKITFKEKGLCCVIFDMDGKIYLISNSGEIVRRLNFLSIGDEALKIYTANQINESSEINPEVIKKLVEIRSFDFGDTLKYQNVSLSGEKIILITEENKEIILDQNTSLESFRDRFVEMTSYLKSNSKDYLSLDFRFEKIVVK